MEYKDVNSELCIRCGACCKISIPLSLDDRTHEFYQVVGLDVTINEHPEIGPALEVGYCQHMEIKDGFYKCQIYDSRPQLCRDFNCLAWAICANIKDKFPALAHATKVFEEMRQTNSN